MSSPQACKPATAATPVAESAGHGVSDGGAQSARFGTGPRRGKLGLSTSTPPCRTKR
jgi:hypothetical protein